MYVTFQPCFTYFCLIAKFCNFIEKEPYAKFNGVLYYFLESHQITKFWMIKRCLQVSDLIPGNEHT